MKRIFFSVMCLAACGDDDDDDDGPQPSADADVSPLEFSTCADDERLGILKITPTSSGSRLDGRLFDLPSASAAPILLGEDGDCQWYRGALHLCDPACAGNQECNADGMCTPRPTALSAGTLAVNGTDFETDATRQFYYTGNLPGAVAVGAAVTLNASGGDLEPFTLRGQGVDAMDVTTADDVLIQSGQAVTVEWTPPTISGSTKVIVDLNINGHGGSGSQVVCTVDDTGSFTIPAGLVTSLVEDGLSGFPDLTLTRLTADSAAIAAGCVELRVESSESISVQTGVVSCNDDEDCPKGQTCSDSLVCE